MSEGSEEAAEVDGVATSASESAESEPPPNFGLDPTQPGFIAVSLFVLLNVVALVAPGLLPWQQG